MSPPTTVSARGARVVVVLVVLATLALVLVMAGAFQALDTLFMASTSQEGQARGEAAYVRLWVCAAGMVAVGVGYWTVARSRAAGVLMVLAAAAAAVGLLTYALVPALVLAAVVLSVFGPVRTGRGWWR